MNRKPELTKILHIRVTEQISQRLQAEAANRAEPGRGAGAGRVSPRFAPGWLAGARRSGRRFLEGMIEEW